ncbi:hypothetical protein DEU56DRAFT_927410 [Suillus clintonianus]|uniref:uncharacterized protein n=1 Tax=Suillus clintonianus TaxID=1904413 RepID=UPI001B880AA0|nr:uncharacterized protein DEU56DRAFT_927410 [Suillus clintonianus]KAG2121482.1 hypothetical protein DEU56DRAFT_927410 [Suillus clintonianus]
MSDNPLKCLLPGCEGTPEFLDKTAARRHRYRYHAVPVPFEIQGSLYIIAHSNTRYSCPLPGCGQSFKQRDSIEHHIVTDHNDGTELKIFGTPAPALPGNPIQKGAGNTSAKVLVPAATSTQEIASSGTRSNVNSGKAHLMPGVDYLKSNEVLDALGIPPADLQAVLDFCSKSKVYTKPQHVKLPAAGGPPVQLLGDPSDGLACKASSECEYCVRDLQTMQRHRREKHGSTALGEVCHRPCKVQRLFTGVGGSFFEIGQKILPGARPNLKETLKATFLPAIDVPLVVPADTERERTPLVKFMGWDKFQNDVRMNPAQRRAAEQIKKKHTEEEHGGIFPRLAIAIQDHFVRAATILDGHPQRLSLAKILIHGDAIPRESNSHWKPISAENSEYANFMLQLFRNIIRIHLGFALDFSFSLSALQTRRLEDLLTVLRDEAASPRKRMIAYHDLAWSFVNTDPSLCATDHWGNPIQRAIWLRALRADGNFCEANILTPDLAKIKYLCNMTSLLEALMDKEDETDSVHADDNERVMQIHQQVLQLGRPHTFNIVYEMQQYASALALNQMKEPNVYVDPDVKSITIGTQTMQMDKLRQGIQDRVNDLTLRYAALTNDNIMLTRMPDHVKDDLTNTRRGYSFMSEEPFYEKRHSLFFFLVQSHNLAMVDNEGRIAWNIPGIKEFLRRSLRVWEPLYHLLFIVTHISCRGTQFVDHQITNADRHRNLFMGGKEMFVLTAYSKKTGITDRDSCTPGFVPKDIAFWVLEMLGGGLRTAEAILAGVAYGKESEHLYRTYLCVAEGQRITAAKFSDSIQHWNLEYFDCRWGLRDFRQGAITMGREFIAADHSYDETDNILSESADHSTAMDHSHYAVVLGAVPRLSNNSMCKHRWLGDQWHSVLGLGPLPPPEPIRTSRKSMSNGTTLESIGDLVKKTTSSALQSFFENDFSTMLKDVVSAALAPPPRQAVNWEKKDSGELFDSCRADPSATTREGSPAPSGYIECGNMLSDSPLPASSIESLSQTESIDDFLPSPDIIIPTYGSATDYKGKGRAYEPGQPRPSKSKPASVLSISSADSASHSRSSSLSPVTDYKRKAGTRKPGQSKHQSDLGSLPSSAPVAAIYRSRKHTLEHVSETEGEQEPPKRLKRLRRPTASLPKENEDWEIMDPTTDEDLSDFIVPDSSRASSPPPAVVEIREQIRDAIRFLRKDPTAKEKSREQMDALVGIMTETRDVLVAMKTGGGKSMMWMVPSILDENAKSIVVCPFVALLEEQYKKTVAGGLRCHNYSQSKEVPDDVQVLFIQVEHCSSTVFANLLVSPLGNKFTRAFVDEFHDNVNCHPERIKAWGVLARQFSAMRILICLLSATAPPHRLSSFIKPFGMKVDNLAQFRSSTNRPEIGMHVVPVQPIIAQQSLGRLVCALNGLLDDDERILVFFCSQVEAETFAVLHKCAVYHSNLWANGNTKAYNLDLWDRGESKVMACTTAFAQGIDRSKVRFVVIFKPAYGLVVNNQMLGRAGRDGRESHVFFVSDVTGIASFKGSKRNQDECLLELDRVVHGPECRRYTNTVCMDGVDLATRCNQEPRGVPCDICDPDSPMQQFAIQALSQEQTSISHTPAVQAPPPAFVPASRLAQTMENAPAMSQEDAEPAQPLSQDSDALYGMDSQITSSQALVLDAIEVIHKPRDNMKNIFMPSASSSSRLQLPPPSSLPSDSRTFASRAEQCCLPQSRNHNGEEPACHAGLLYKKGVTCPFSGFIFKTVFCFWSREEFRRHLIQDVSQGAQLSTLTDFIAWAVQEHAEEGKYNNCVEAFLWFCSEVEKAKPDFFM